METPLGGGSLVLRSTPSRVEAALLDRSGLIELRVFRPFPGSVRGATFKARVIAHDAALDAAFVDCGQGEPALLRKRDARVGSPNWPLQEGQSILVQVRREPLELKGAQVTSDIAITGPRFQLHPLRSAPGSRAPGPQAGALVARTGGADTASPQAAAEVQRLALRWQAIERVLARAGAPAVIEPPPEPVERALIDLVSQDLGALVAADPMTHVRIRRWLQVEQFGLPLDLMEGAFEHLGISDDLDLALGETVPLPGGGSVVIEPTAALTAIDVNGGGRKPLEVDLEAAAVVARQVRLRRIGGTIVIDFLDLTDLRARERLHSSLKRAFENDPEPVQIWPMSPLGLVQIVRRRSGPALRDDFARRCAACAGAGWIHEETAGE